MRCGKPVAAASVYKQRASSRTIIERAADAVCIRRRRRRVAEFAHDMCIRARLGK